MFIRRQSSPLQKPRPVEPTITLEDYQNLARRIILRVVNRCYDSKVRLHAFRERVKEKYGLYEGHKIDIIFEHIQKELELPWLLYNHIITMEEDSNSKYFVMFAGNNSDLVRKHLEKRPGYKEHRIKNRHHLKALVNRKIRKITNIGHKKTVYNG